MQRIGLQLWSVKELAEKDFFGTLSDVRASGYDGVEFAGYYGATAQEVKRVLDDLGLVACGSHTGIHLLQETLGATLEYNQQLGNPYIVIPGLPGEMTESRDAWLRTAEAMQHIGERVHAAGMQLFFHNHAGEFADMGGETGLQLLLHNTSKEALCFELDTFWAIVAGFDPIAVMKEFGERCALLHIKEALRDDPHTSTVVGEGSTHWAPILSLSQEMDIPWLIVEQEEFQRDMLESVRDCCTNLRALIS